MMEIAFWNSTEWNELCLRIVLTLGHFLWQGLVVGALMLVLLQFLRNTSSHVRYRVCLLTQLGLLLFPLATFSMLENVEMNGRLLANAAESASSPASSWSHKGPASNVLNSIPLRRNEAMPVESIVVARGHESTSTWEPTRPQQSADDLGTAQLVGMRHSAEDATRRAGDTQQLTQSQIQFFAPWLVLLYALCVIVALSRTVLGICGGRRLRSSRHSGSGSRVAGYPRAASNRSRAASCPAHCVL